MKTSLLRLLLIVTTVLWSMICYADESKSSQGYENLDPASREALAKTLQLLTSPKAREANFRANPNQKEADDRVTALAGSEQNKQEIYELSAEIFDDMIKEAKGDATKVMEILEKARKNPEEFARKLKEKQQTRLRKIAGTLTAGEPKEKP